MDIERVLSLPGPNPSLWWCRHCASCCIVLFGVPTRCPQCASPLEQVERSDARALLVELLGDATLIQAWDGLAEAAILGRLDADQEESLRAVLMGLRAAAETIVSPSKGD